MLFGNALRPLWWLISSGVKMQPPTPVISAARVQAADKNESPCELAFPSFPAFYFRFVEYKERTIPK